MDVNTTYDAKKAGKNQISFFNATIEKEVRRRLLMEELLHTALEADEFYLVYQTKVDLVTEKIKGTEGQLHWGCGLDPDIIFRARL